MQYFRKLCVLGLIWPVFLFSQPEPVPYAPIANPLPEIMDQMARDSVTVRIGRVRVNQAGYRPGDRQWFYYVGNASVFSVINTATGVPAGTGIFASTGQSASGAIQIKASNNAALQYGGDTRYEMTGPAVSGAVMEGMLPAGLPEGVYHVVVNADTSEPFIIDSRVYTMVKDALLKFYGLQRSGDSDNWFHPPSHTRDMVPGGWYDCGDHLKIGTTQSFAMAVLGVTGAGFQDRDTDHYGRNHAHTVNTDGVPDMLAELRHGAEFLFASWKLAGGSVAGMVTSIGDGKDHMWWGTPEFQDMQIRDRGGPVRPDMTTLSTPVLARFAAGMAFFSRLYRPFDSVYAAGALPIAVAMYNHAAAIYTNQDHFAYGGDGSLPDDLALAALAVAWASGDVKYLNDAIHDEAAGSWAQSTVDANPRGMFKSGWFAKENGSLLHGSPANTSYGSVQMYALWTLYRLFLKDPAVASAFGIAEQERLELIEDVVYSVIRNIISIGKGDASIDLPDPSNAAGALTYESLWKNMYVIEEWVWSRYQAGNMTELFVYYDIAKDLKGKALPNTPASENWMAGEVLGLVVRQMDYMLGVNPWDVSMIAGIGDKNFNHPHHRAANPEGRNTPGAMYPFRQPVGALQGSYDPGTSLFYEDWFDHTHTEVCLDGTTAMLLPTVGLAAREDMQAGPGVTVEIEYVGSTEAYINVRQSRFGTASLSFGTSAVPAALSGSLSDTAGVRHRFHLEGLLPGMTYYFEVRAGNALSGAVTVKNNEGRYYSFTTAFETAGPADMQNITVCNITADSAEILWYTPNGAFQSKVKWDIGPVPYGQMRFEQAGDDGGIPTKFHKVSIGGLAEQTTYYFGAESEGQIIYTDNTGAPLQFTTPVEYADFEIMSLRYMWGTQPGLGLNIINNDVKAYDSLDIRVYFKSADSLETDLGARVDICLAYDEAGFNHPCADETNIRKRVAFSKPVRMEETCNAADGTCYYYLSLPLGATMMKSGSRIRLDVIFDRRSPWPPFEDLMGQAPEHVMTDADWSFGPHSRAAGAPVDFGGVKDGPKEDMDASYWNYEINPYLTVYRKGEFVWGFSPSAQEQAAKRAHYEMTLLLDPPFNVPNGSHVDITGVLTNTVNITGTASITEAGFITDIWAKGARVPVTTETVRYDIGSDTWVLNIPVEMADGGNSVDVTVFAGPNPECTACAGRGGCAFENRSFFLEYSVRGRYASTMTLREGGEQMTAPFQVRPDTTQFLIELHDSTGAGVTTLPVTLFNPGSGYSLDVPLTLVDDRKFMSGPVFITGGFSADPGTLRFGMQEGDSLWIRYVDPADPGDTALRFLQMPASFPLPTAGYLQDRDNDGMVETIHVSFDRALVIPPDSVAAAGGLQFGPACGDVFMADSTGLDIRLSAPMAPPADISGTAFFTVDGRIARGVFDFAPFIRRAEVLYAQDVLAGDTLILDFSSDILVQGTPSFMFMFPGEDQQDVRISSVLGYSGNRLYLLTSVGGALDNIEPGDRVRIGSGISDLNGIPAGPHNPWSAVTGAPRDPQPMLLSGRYIDSNGDGYLDSAYLVFEYAVNISGLQIALSRPEAGLMATASAFTVSDTNVLAVDLNLAFGDGVLSRKTGGIMTARDKYGSVALADGAGPVLVSAEIVPPAIKVYILADDPDRILHVNPDTLVIRVSEILVMGGSPGSGPWKNLFSYRPGCRENAERPLNAETLPSVGISDSSELMFPVGGGSGGRIQIGDCLYFGVSTPYTDRAGNPPSPEGVYVDGDMAAFSDNFKTGMLQHIIGTSAHYSALNLPELEAVPILDENGQVVGSLAAGTVADWISPMYMDGNGRINESAQASCFPGAVQDQAPREVKPNCLSLISVISQGPYTAEVAIYDNVGKFVHRSVQKFGYCGELEDLNRFKGAGFVSFLIWNQRDGEGRLVGSGVYVWRVKYHFMGGRASRTEIYRQGVARGEAPAEGCAAGF